MFGFGGPTNKYRGLSLDPIDGTTPLRWNAHPDGYPVRNGDAPGLIDKRSRDLASVNLFVRSEVLEIPRDTKRYVEITDWIANGMAVLRFEERRPSRTDDGKWHVWLVWVDVRGFIPKLPGGPPPDLQL